MTRSQRPPDGVRDHPGTGHHGRHRDDVVDLRLDDGTATDCAPWPARSATRQLLDDARAQLVLHRLDPRIGRCCACDGAAPCEPSQTAAQILAQAGAWNTAPFTSPARMDTRLRAPAPQRWFARLAHGLKAAWGR